jgi:hypothetical protein
VRCTSTGRTCDGYGSQSSAATKRPAVQNRTVQALVASSHCLSGLRTLRPLIASVNGTEKERMFFDTYLRIVDEGMALHVANSAAFWQITIPQAAQLEAPVKHAYVALGAALHGFQRKEREPQNRRDPTTALTPIERFGLDQYGRALSLLRQGTQFGNLDHIEVVILCCIAFIYIEILRDNVGAALTHLTNGLRIASTLPDHILAPLGDQKHRKLSDRYAGQAPKPRLLGMLAQLAVLEISACVFHQNFKPVISLRLLDMRKYDDFPVPELCDLKEVHLEVSLLVRDTFALLYVSKTSEQGATFWEMGTWALQRSILFSRMKQIKQRLADFTKSPYMPKIETSEYTSLLLDIFFFHVIEVLFFSLFPPTNMTPDDLAQHAAILNTPVHHHLIERDLIPAANSPPATATLDRVLINPALLSGSSSSDASPPLERTAAFARRMEEIVILAEVADKAIYETSTTNQRDRWLILDVGLNTPLHYVVDKSRHDPSLRERALEVMRRSRRRENLWDGATISQLWSAVERSRADVVIPSSMVNSLAVSSLYQEFGGLQISDP